MEIGDPAPPPQKGGRVPKFSVHAYCGQTAGWIKMHLAWRWASVQATLCSMGTKIPQKRGHSPQFSAHVCCGQTAVCIMIPLSMEVGLTLGDIVLDRVAACPYKGHSPQFSAHVYCGRGCPSQLLLASCLSSKSRSSEINLHFVIRWRCRVIRWWKLAEKRLGRREARCCACIVRLNLCWPAALTESWFRS